jgi:macrolide transport system ATP-binding/permease protein
LINDPRIILADEPTGNLDSKSEREIMDLLMALNQRGITIIVVTHEEEIAQFARRVIRMRDGVVQSDERKEANDQAKSLGDLAVPVVDDSVRAFLRELGAHFSEGLKSILANKVRAGLSMLGILIGVAAVIAMLALGRGAQQAIETQLASLGSNLLVLRPGAARVGGVRLDAGSVTRLTVEDADANRQEVPGVKRVACEVNGRVQAAYGDKNWSTSVLSTNADYAPMRAAVPEVGRFFDDDEDRKRTKVVLLGLTVASNLFGDADPIGEMVKLNKISFRVIGLVPERGANGFRDQDDIVMIPLQTGMRRLLGKDYVDNIDIEVRSQDQMEAVQDRVTDLVNHRHRVPASQDTFQIRNMADIQAALSETSKTMSMLLASIAAISLLVGGIGIMNIMLVSVTERTREIGLRKAIGARRKDILSQFLIEAVVVSLTGGGLGIVLGMLITVAMAKLAHWATAVSPEAIILATFFSAGTGIVFGLWPARKASRLRPIEALRYE